ncbi:MAG TPA: general stress protein [Candidatus Binataceae bacterium]|nr:general stress protein [Candidatus Binataceae bacterium]
MAKAIICVVRSEKDADQLINRLRESEFTAQEVSVVTQDRRERKELKDAATKTRVEGMAAGAVTGGLLLGGLGWIAGIVALAIPGIGPILAAGPIVAALGDAAIGGGIGLIGGALLGMRMPDHVARYYEEALQNGHSLVAVHSDDPVKRQKAREIFEAAGGEHISELDESRI